METSRTQGLLFIDFGMPSRLVPVINIVADFLKFGVLEWHVLLQVCREWNRHSIKWRILIKPEVSWRHLFKLASFGLREIFVKCTKKKDLQILGQFTNLQHIGIQGEWESGLPQIVLPTSITSLEILHFYGRSTPIRQFPFLANLKKLVIPCFTLTEIETVFGSETVNNIQALHCYRFDALQKATLSNLQCLKFDFFLSPIEDECYPLSALTSLTHLTLPCHQSYHDLWCPELPTSITALELLLRSETEFHSFLKTVLPVHQLSVLSIGIDGDPGLYTLSCLTVLSGLTSLSVRNYSKTAVVSLESFSRLTHLTRLEIYGGLQVMNLPIFPKLVEFVICVEPIVRFNLSPRHNYDFVGLLSRAPNLKTVVVITIDLHCLPKLTSRWLIDKCEIIEITKNVFDSVYNSNCRHCCNKLREWWSKYL